MGLAGTGSRSQFEQQLLCDRLFERARKASRLCRATGAADGLGETRGRPGAALPGYRIFLFEMDWWPRLPQYLFKRATRIKLASNAMEPLDIALQREDDDLRVLSGGHCAAELADRSPRVA